MEMIAIVMGVAAEINSLRNQKLPSFDQQWGQFRSSGVTRLFVRYCTLRIHLLNEEAGRESSAASLSVDSYGMSGFGW
jgi:hypothetical protein